MKKYRIKPFESRILPYQVQKRYLLFIWVNIGHFASIKECEDFVEMLKWQGKYL